ncbi:MAG: hypothetical protein NDP24_00245 [Crenarchaeota archaeon]|nr:hypothetical protein [Thermoproteota archaeon]MCR8471311.1 hypothetical protein [Thermoproteota archaeon]
MRRIIALASTIILLLAAVPANSINHPDMQIYTNQQQALRIFSNLKPVYVVASSIGLNVTDTIGVQNVGDTALIVSVSWKLAPEELQRKIRVTPSPSEFSIYPGEYRDIFINILVLSGVFPGFYNLSIIISWRSDSTQGGSIVIASSVVFTYILIGERNYRLKVVLKQPDGSLTHGDIIVSYYYANKYVPIYRVHASNFTFFVIEGRYLVEVYLGGIKRSTQEIEVNSDVIIPLVFSPIYISRFSVVSKPLTSRDSLIFSAELRNDDPLIYKKLIAVTVSLFRGSEILIRNETIATLTVRSTVVKDVLGYLEPPEQWTNGTYSVLIEIYSQGKLLYNNSYQISLTVYAPVIIKYFEELTLPVVLIVSILGILFGFIGAKIALRRVGLRYLLKTVGIIAGREYIAYDVRRNKFTDPAYISGEWSKILFAFNLLSRKYWSKPEDIEKRRMIVISTNAEKWIFYAIIKDTSLFLCIHSACNEFDLLEKIARLKVYFSKKLQEHSLHEILVNPEETLSDITKKITELFL